MRRLVSKSKNFEEVVAKPVICFSLLLLLLLLFIYLSKVLTKPKLSQ